MTDNGDKVSGDRSKLLGSEFGDKIEPLGDKTWSVLRLELLLDDDRVELHCPSGDILLGSQCSSIWGDGCSFLGLCEFTLNVRTVVTVKLFCGVLDLDHLGGGGGGVFALIVSFFNFDKSEFSIFVSTFGSIKFIKFKVLGLVGLTIGVEGSAVLNVVISGFKFRTKSTSGLDAFEGGGLYLQNSCPKRAKEDNCCLVLASRIALGKVNWTGNSSQQLA